MAASGLCYRKPFWVGHFFPPLNEWARKPSSGHVGSTFLAMNISLGLCTHLEVPVDDTIGVAVLDALQDLLDAVTCIFLTVELSSNNVIE